MEELSGRDADDMTTPWRQEETREQGTRPLWGAPESGAGTGSSAPGVWAAPPASESVPQRETGLPAVQAPGAPLPQDARPDVSVDGAIGQGPGGGGPLGQGSFEHGSFERGSFGQGPFSQGSLERGPVAGAGTGWPSPSEGGGHVPPPGGEPPDAGTWPYGGPPPPPRGPSRRRRAAFVAVVGVTALVFGGTGVAVGSLTTHSSGSTVTTSSTAGPAAFTAATSGTVQAALAKIEPSVVLINTTTGGSGRFGGGGGSASGTGIIITSDGQVVTNAHVVSGATSISVSIPGHSDPVTATVIGADTTKDLALIQLKGVSGLPVAEFAASSTVKVGDEVIAIGNAEGYGGSPTVTQGIISALNRDLPESNSTLHNLLQTDAAINPGNSGGPLVDTSGRVVGINTAVATGQPSEPAQNIGFAIPSDTVTAALSELRAGGSSGQSTTDNGAFLGVSITSGIDGGAVIVSVTDGSPAASAGLQANDVITAVDGTSVSGPDALQSAIQEHKPGDSVTLTYSRNGTTHTAKVTLGSRPATGA